MPSTNMVAARLPDGRLLIASLDPTTPHHHSPLRQALRAHRLTLDTHPANTTLTSRRDSDARR